MNKSWILLTFLFVVWAATGCQGHSVRGSAGGTKVPEVPEGNRKAAEANYQLGVVYMQNGELQIALEKLQKAIKYNPYSSPAHSALGMLYDRTNEVDLADKSFRKSIEYNYNNADVHNAYGSYLCNRQRYEEAEKELLLAANNPYFKTPEISFTNLGICLKKSGDLARAEEYFRKALEKNPTYPQGLYQMTQVFLEKKNFAKAEFYYDRFQGRIAESSGQLWMGYQIQQGLGNIGKASAYADALTKKFPDSRQALEYMESKIDEK